MLNQYPYSWTRTNLIPVCREIAQRVMGCLPEPLAHRLVPGRTLRIHGSFPNLLLYTMWDSHQTDLLPKHHFCYCLGHYTACPPSGQPNGYLQIWLNCIRIYRDRDAIVDQLQRGVRQHCPAGFTYYDGRAVEAKMSFAFPRTAAELMALLVPAWTRLVSALHPVLMPIIDAQTAPMTAAERHAVVQSCLKNQVRGRRLPLEHRRQFTRSIPPSWRQAVLDAFSYNCAICKKNLRHTTAHMDHIQPFSRGGFTVRENLQPLCPACNLAKGNRPPTANP